MTPNQYGIRVSANGQYSMADVPPGKYTVVAWHKTGGTFRKTIEVTAGRDAVAELSLCPWRAFAAGGNGCARRTSREPLEYGLRREHFCGRSLPFAALLAGSFLGRKNRRALSCTQKPSEPPFRDNPGHSGARARAKRIAEHTHPSRRRGKSRAEGRLAVARHRRGAPDAARRTVEDQLSEIATLWASISWPYPGPPASRWPALSVVREDSRQWILSLYRCPLLKRIFPRRAAYSR